MQPLHASGHCLFHPPTASLCCVVSDLLLPQLLPVCLSTTAGPMAACAAQPSPQR